MPSGIGWGAFASQEPELAQFGTERLTAAPAYLATIRPTGHPRVHPVTPIVTTGGLYLFMEPSSPKGLDLRERPWYALHNGVPDSGGSGGEFFLSGEAVPVDDAGLRALAAGAASYDPAGPLRPVRVDRRRGAMQRLRRRSAAPAAALDQRHLTRNRITMRAVTHADRAQTGSRSAT
jgi:hypothetical protein